MSKFLLIFTLEFVKLSVIEQDPEIRTRKIDRLYISHTIMGQILKSLQLYPHR